MDPEVERALVSGLRDGDRGAFDAVYREFHRPLFNFLARLGRRRDLAEDLLEETWLRLASHARKLSPDTRLGPWLFTVARNLYVSYCRSRALDDALTSDPIGLWPVSPAPPSPFESAAAGELECAVERALAGLPRIYREVVLLAASGFTSPEAAGVCGITSVAARQRLSRGRDMLARALARPGDGGKGLETRFAARTAEDGPDVE